MSMAGWVWRPPPGWPEPPPGWTPPPGWQPPADWPPPPEGWAFWIPAPAAHAGGRDSAAQWPAPARPAPQPGPPGVQPDAAQPPQPAAAAPPAGPAGGTGPAGLTRRGLVWETVFVQLAFLLPSVVSAVVTLAAHLSGAGDMSFFPTVVRGHPVENLILSGASYLGVGAVVPLALLLLARTGSTRAALGLADRRWRDDLLPAVGIAAAGYGTAFATSAVLAPLLSGQRALFSQLSIGRVPAYYILYGVLVAAITGITEETLVNGYLLTRLEQLGWQPRRALLLSLALRTSYHVYYGLGLIFTIPFGYFATRSFQKHRRLGRPIVAHFLYDATLVTISVLVAAHR
jgi:membrane protease YdiL (CAAX protease family)